MPFERDGQRFELIDTAGLRRKGTVFEAIEKFSVVKTLQAIADANVVVLLLDATQGVERPGRAHRRLHPRQRPRGGGGGQQVGRGRRLPARDAASARSRSAWRSCATRRVLHISARKRQGLAPLWKAIGQAHASARAKMPTPVLTRLVHEAVAHQAPKRAGALRPKLRYAHQGGMNPPIVVIHGNALEHVTDAYKRYLEGRIREHFKLVGTPLRIEMRSSRNPFDSD